MKKKERGGGGGGGGGGQNGGVQFYSYSDEITSWETILQTHCYCR